jgi:ribosomal RNA-processing protein 17
MFAKPRPKKSILPPPTKKRKTTPAIEEISFDFDARQEYLTGFHKRKQQRIKNAQEEAAKRARLERIEARKQVETPRFTGLLDHAYTGSVADGTARCERSASAMWRSMSRP